MLGMFEATGANMFTSMWSSLFGSATAFALMALLPEYIIVCIYIRVLHFRVRTCREMDQLLGESREGAGHEMSGKSVAGNFRVRGWESAMEDNRHKGNRGPLGACRASLKGSGWWITPTRTGEIES
jgi:hypothetical protein